MGKRRRFMVTIVEVRLVPHLVEVVAEAPAGAIHKARRVLRDTGIVFSEKRSAATAEPVDEPQDVMVPSKKLEGRDPASQQKALDAALGVARPKKP